MKLYQIITKFWGKDLNESASLGYVIADSEEEVAEYISQSYHDGEWFGYEDDDPDEYAKRRQDYLANKGDIHTEYDGEFYDQKYGWEGVGEVTDEQIAVLQNLGVLQELLVANEQPTLSATPRGTDRPFASLVGWLILFYAKFGM